MDNLQQNKITVSSVLNVLNLINETKSVEYSWRAGPKGRKTKLKWQLHKVRSVLQALLSRESVHLVSRGRLNSKHIENVAAETVPP